MKTTRKQILLVSSGLVTVSLLASCIIHTYRSEPSQAGATSRPQSGERAKGTTKVQETPEEIDKGLNAAVTETDPARRQKLLKEWAHAVALGDMEEMLAQIELIENTNLRSEIRRALLSSWIERDMNGVAAWFGKENRGDDLHKATRDLLLQALCKEDAGSALFWMQKTMSGLGQNELYASFFQQWAKTNPSAACAKLSELAFASNGNPRLLNNLFSQVVGQWASSDVYGAMRWAQSLPNGQVKTQALMEVSQQLAETNPQQAATYAAQQDNPALLAAIAGKWTQSDPAAAEAWANGLPTGAGRDGAMASVATAWAQTDPAAAATYAASLPPGDAQKQAVLSVVSVWAYTAPDQAVQWIAQFPEGAEREQALQITIGAWANTSADEAGQWLKEMPNTPSRDLAVSTYAGALDSTSPNTAFSWAGTISNAAMREQQLERAAGAWLRVDPMSAQLAINQSNIPANIKRQLLASPDPR